MKISDAEWSDLIAAVRRQVDRTNTRLTEAGSPDLLLVQEQVGSGDGDVLTVESRGQRKAIVRQRKTGELYRFLERPVFDNTTGHVRTVTPITLASVARLLGL